MAFDLGRTQAMATLDADAIGRQFIGHAGAGQPIGHHGQAVALLHAQLGGNR